MAGPPAYYISKVVLDNFKSFLGRTEIAAFRPDFTAIIGPNGCGKSNLMEAIVFALDSKSLSRSPSNIHYIHHSKKDKAALYAAVSVHFRNAATDHETVVSRKVTETNSTLEIDGRVVKRGDVQSYCATLGIDVCGNRFSILQGEVQLFTTMPPTSGGVNEGEGNLRKQGLLEYFDELIGTKKYRRELQETESLITSLSEEVGRLVPAHDMIQFEIIRMMPSLKSCFKYMRRVLKRYLLFNFQFQVERCSELSVLEKLKGKKGETEAERYILSQEIEECQRKLHVIDKIVSNITGSIGKINFELKELKDNRKAWEGILKESKEIREEKEASIRQLRSKKPILISQAAENATLEERYNAELIVLQEKIERSDSELAWIAEQLRETYSDPRMQQLVEELMPIVEDQRKAEQSLREVEKDIKNCKDKLEENQKSRENARKRFEENQVEIAQLQSKLINLDQSMESYEQVHAKLQQSITQLSAKSLKLEVRQQALAAFISNLESSMQKSQRKVEKQTMRNHLHSQLREAIETKKVEGVLGRLGDLGEINEEIDVAVSTVFHRSLDSYVAENIEAAEELIDYVRRNRIGKVEVIVLDKIADKNTHFRSPNTAVRRIFDLVTTTNSQVVKAFYHTFGNTLVAENIEIARKVAFEGDSRWSVATLQGDFLARDGAMQGFATVRKGAMRISGGGNAEMRESAESLRHTLGEKRKEMEVVETEMADLRKQIDLLTKKEQFEQSEYKTKSLAKNGLLTQLQDLQSLNEHPPSSELEHDKALEDEIASLQQQRDENYIGLQSILSRREGINIRLSELKSPEILELEKREGLLKSDRNFIEVEISNITVKLKKISLEQEKRTKKINDLVSKIDSIDTELEELRQKIYTDNENLVRVRGNIATRKAKLAELSTAKRDNETQRPMIEEKQKSLMEVDPTLERRILELKRDIKAKEEEVGRICAEIIANRREYHRTFEDFTAKVSGLEIEPELISGSDENSRLFSLEIQPKGNRSRFFRGIDEDFDASKVSKNLQQLKSDVLRLIKSLDSKLETEENLHFIDTFRSASQELENISTKLDQTYNELYTRRTKYEQLRQARLAEFRFGCDHISRELRKVYELFTDTGMAEIEYCDPADPYLCGIYLSVRPPEKSWKRMESLSGGERTLVALALVFAMHDYKPNGVYMMDEIDASLDFINVQKVASYIRKRKTSAQFVVVSLRSQMFEKADALIGVYKPIDVSQVVSIVPSACLSEDHSNPIIRATAALV